MKFRFLFILSFLIYFSSVVNAVELFALESRMQSQSELQSLDMSGALKFPQESELEKTKEAFKTVGNGIKEGALVVGDGIKKKALAMVQVFQKVGKVTKDFLTLHPSEN